MLDVRCFFISSSTSAFGRVFDGPAFGLQFVPDRISAFEIFHFLRGGPRFGQRQNFSGNFRP